MHVAGAGPGSTPSLAVPRGRAVAILVGVVALVATTAYFAFRSDRAGESSFWILAGGPTLALAPVALWWASKRGELRGWMYPKGGDFTRGFLGAAALFMAAYEFSKLVTPSGSPRAIWLARLYLQLGDPGTLREHPTLLFVAFVLVATAEEIVWRGLVMGLLAEVLPRNRGPASEDAEDADAPPRVPSRWVSVASAGLYALAYVPAMWALAAPSGPNPLLPIAAFGAGLVWADMARRFGRLPPGIIAHALFDWCVVVMFRLWGESL